MKLSEAQLRVLYWMNNGWELGYSEGFYYRAWLQKGGCGYGGESKDVNVNTFFALWKKKAIEENKKPHFHTTTYKLTEEARGLVEKWSKE